MNSFKRLLLFLEDVLKLFLFLDPNELVLEVSRLGFKSSSTLSGLSSMVTGLTLEAAGLSLWLLLDLNLDLESLDPMES